MAKETKKPVVEIKPGASESGITKEKFAALVEAYKKQNPVKYAEKEAVLLKKLNSL